MFRRIMPEIELFLNKYSIKQKFFFLVILFFLSLPPNFFKITTTLDFKRRITSSQLVADRIYLPLNEIKSLILQLLKISLTKGGKVSDEKYAEIVDKLTGKIDFLDELVQQLTESPLPPLSSEILLQAGERPEVGELRKNLSVFLEAFKKEPFTRGTLQAYNKVDQSVDLLAKSAMAYSGISSSNVSTVYFVNQLDLQFLQLYKIIYHLIILNREKHSNKESQNSVEYARYLDKFSGVLNSLHEGIQQAFVTNKSFTLNFTEFIPLFTAQTKESVEYDFDNVHDLLIDYVNLENKSDIFTVKNLVERSIDKLNGMTLSLTKLMEEVLVAKQKRIKLFAWITYATFILYFAIMLFLLITKFMSNHLQNMIDRLKVLASGDYRECHLTVKSDDLGRMSQGFITLSNEINNKLVGIDIRNNEVMVSKADFVNLMNIRKHNVKKLVEGIGELDVLINEINDSATGVNDKIAALRHDSEKSSVEEKAKEGFDRLMEQITNQKNHSVKIIEQLQTVLSNVSTTMGLVNCLSKVGNQTQLLYLNAAIEANAAGKYRESFMNTVTKLDRFSMSTNAATSKITMSTGDLYRNTKETLRVFYQYMTKGRRSSDQLNVLQKHLSKITEEFSKQGNEFEIIKGKMDGAVKAIDEITVLFNDLKDKTERNAVLIDAIDNSLDSIGAASKLVEETLHHFQFASKDN